MNVDPAVALDVALERIAELERDNILLRAVLTERSPEHVGE